MSLINGYDTSYRLTVYTALYNQILGDNWKNGKFFIGRYLTNASNGIDKKMTEAEVKKLCKAGIDIVSIFQTGHFNSTNYTYAKGVTNAQAAIAAATALGQPSNKPIYFATEPDFTDADHPAGTLTSQDISIAQNYLNGVNSVITDNAQNPKGYKLASYAPDSLCSYIHSWFPNAPIMCGHPHASFSSWSIRQEYNPDGYNGNLVGSVDFDTAQSSSYGGWHKHFYPSLWEDYSSTQHRRKCYGCNHYTYAGHNPNSNGVCVDCGRAGLPIPQAIEGEENE